MDTDRFPADLAALAQVRPAILIFNLLRHPDHIMKSTYSRGPTPAFSAVELEPRSSADGHESASKISHRIDAGTIFVVLPAFNEAAGMPSLLTKIQLTFAANGRDYHVIVVDDASTDNTAEIASKATFKMPLTLVQHAVNQNLPGGATIRIGRSKPIGG